MLHLIKFNEIEKGAPTFVLKIKEGERDIKLVIIN